MNDLFVYVTPNKKWAIARQSDLLGKRIYTLWTNIDNEWHYRRWSKKDEVLDLLWYLGSINVISSDEVKYQTGVLESMEAGDEQISWKSTL